MSCLTSFSSLPCSAAAVALRAAILSALLRGFPGLWAGLGLVVADAAAAWAAAKQ